MKRGSKIILFIAMTALTFGSLNYFIGRRHWGNGFRNHRGCGDEMRLDNAPQSTAPVKSI
jgi:hypothetical protein